MNKVNFVSLIALNIVRIGMKNSAIKQENKVQLSRKIVLKKSANKQQNSANKHPELLSPITVIMEAIAFHTSIFQNNSVLIICSFVIVISSQNKCGRRSSARGRAQQLDIFPL